MTQICTSAQYEKADGSCGNCASTCNTCYGGSSYECMSCSPATYMLNGQCIAACPAAYFASGDTCVACPTNCLTCSNSTACTSCVSGFVYHQSTMSCVSDCSTLNTAAMSYYKSGTNCQACSNMDINCVVCGYGTGNILQCSSCQNGSYLYQGTCHTNCPSGTHSTQTPTNVCTPCTANCINCTSSGCTQCSSGFVVSNGQCSASCPQGYFKSTVGGISTC